MTAVTDSFPCTSCGACCRHVDRLGDAFPFSNTDGVCEKFGPDNRCTIYADRPLICRIDDGAVALGVPIKLWHRLTADACVQLQAEENLPEIFRPILK